MADRADPIPPYRQILHGHRTPPSHASPSTIASNSYPNGFAVLAVACLLMETMQAFQEGVACHKKDLGDLILRFLRGDDFWEHGLSFKKPDLFLGEIRNSIMHRGETRRWLIQKRHPKAVDEDREPPVLGAWKFLAALRIGLETYLSKLSECDAADELWQTALYKLEHGIIENACGNAPSEGAKWRRASDSTEFRWADYKKRQKSEEAKARGGKRLGPGG